MLNAKNAKMQNNKLLQNGFPKVCVNVEINFEKKITLNKYRVHHYLIILVLRRKISFIALDLDLLFIRKEVFC